MKREISIVLTEINLYIKSLSVEVQEEFDKPKTNC